MLKTDKNIVKNRNLAQKILDAIRAETLSTAGA